MQMLWQSRQSVDIIYRRNVTTFLNYCIIFSVPNILKISIVVKFNSNLIFKFVDIIKSRRNSLLNKRFNNEISKMFLRESLFTHNVYNYHDISFYENLKFALNAVNCILL